MSIKQAIYAELLTQNFCFISFVKYFLNRTRAGGSNVCNELSSRSHAIFKVTLSMSNQQLGVKSEAVLNLVSTHHCWIGN